MQTVLVTGFESFGGDARNPSAELAQALAGRVIGGGRVVTAVLPCVFGASSRELLALVRRHRPAVVLCLGLAVNRTEITPERVAINIDDARIPDNAGAQPVDRPIVRGGPTAYWSTLPVKPIVTALRRRRLPASVSQTAGTFVCNHVFYALMHALRRQRAVRAGFMHLPWPADWPGHAGAKVTFAELGRAVEAAIAVAQR
ncbi:pyroglutamyl-peptidase I [Opitutus sp. ER46]|uniref:pyroglutamyl-peptidase I n=1 Tax=Opitutus sp. ER46 TaxID=2161864 RepID=UPI000D31F568|nr:pyroglutamyl-peptidase I [Opitutus sp. ER46]PTX94517.1 pyroglutamyl-peptidase I [Opitutus sp. ER46]